MVGVRGLTQVRDIDMETLLSFCRMGQVIVIEDNLIEVEVGIKTS